jgi:hypothetical protein
VMYKLIPPHLESDDDEKSLVNVVRPVSKVNLHDITHAI